MGLFNRFTRKTKQPNQQTEPLPFSPTPHHAALIQKLAQEIITLNNTRKKRATQFASTLMTKNAGTMFIPYENPAIEYLLTLLEALKRDPDPFFFNEAYAEFLQTKNAFVHANRNIFPKRKNSVPLINGVLRRMRLFTRQLNSNTANWNRSPSQHSRTNSFESFSNTESNGSSLPSIQRLRNNTRYRPTRRLKGKLVRPNPSRQPPTEE